MSYRAKEVKKITKLSQQMRDFKIKFGKATGSVKFFWLDNHLEVEEKLWHPVIMLKYLLMILLWVPLLMFSQGNVPLFGFCSFRSSDHPSAKPIIGKKNIKEAIEKDKIFRKNEFDKYSWV